ncbi:MAG: hypothetical protein ACKN9U_09315, partial [Pirellulaceae bacterium]
MSNPRGNPYDRQGARQASMRVPSPLSAARRPIESACIWESDSGWLLGSVQLARGSLKSRHDR